MTKCPHCGKRLQVPEVVFMNADIYGNSNLSVTKCCGKGVMVKPVRSYRIERYWGEKREDDWGHKILPGERPVDG